MRDEKKPPHILVVNDAQEILQVIKDLLEEEGYTVSVYSAAIYDLQQIRNIQPDLVVLDHLIGGEEYGWQMVQKIRLDRELAELPIVVCTAAVRMAKEMEGHLKAKNVTVVLKPFDIDELLNAVKMTLNNQRIDEQQKAAI